MWVLETGHDPLEKQFGLSATESFLSWACRITSNMLRLIRFPEPEILEFNCKEDVLPAHDV